MSVAHTFLFAVGNSTTTWAELPELRGVASDVDKIWDVMVEGSPGRGLAERSGSMKLLNQGAREITARWEEFVAAVEVDALVVFYFAGHGALVASHDVRLLLADSERAQPDRSTLSVLQVIRALERKRVAEWAVILDCCESGEVVRDWAVQGARTRTNVGSLIACAASSGSAWETPEYGGRFTFHLAEAICTGSCMPDGAEFVDLLRASAWAKDRLSEGSFESGARPLIDHWGGADFRVARTPPPASFMNSGLIWARSALVEIGRLPQPGERLVGRDDELARLDAAWTEGSGRRRVLVFVAWGGTGKTSLVMHWLARLTEENYRGARWVLGWSFYSQGTGEGRSDSADEFMAWALEKLGDPRPNEGLPQARAERLARLVRTQRTLLVLDGIEPLQHPPGPEEGKLRDPALAVLLRSLCADSSGLCVVTTRLYLSDLGAFYGRGAESIDLSQIGEDAGGDLLQQLGVVGTREELRTAAHEFGGHALAVELLGQLLVDAFAGDVRARGEIGPLEHEEKRGGHARRVMARYEGWFAGRPERAILDMLGLFDRPAREEALAAVRAAPEIVGLTGLLDGLDVPGWKRALSRLRQTRLVEPANPREPGTVDAHPLVREHFGEVLRVAHPAAWREGHRRLYEFHRASVKALPDTLIEMAPLYAAVHHGCHAGRHQEVLDEVYWSRICRGREFYSIKKLGAVGVDQAALASFFEAPWTTPVAALREADRMWVRALAGNRLRALGRLREATEPIRATLAADINEEEWGNAAISAINLSELHLELGEVARAVDLARQSVEHADLDGDKHWRVVTRTTLADTLHQAGDVEEAARYFAEAEEMQKAQSNWNPRLHSLRGYQYCDLLLGRGEVDEVLGRAEQALVIAERNHWLLDIAVDHLTLGRAHLARCLAGDPDSREHAFRELEVAVAGLYQAGSQDWVPHGLLARAAFFIHTAEIPRARADLDEVLEFAERGSTRLFECDAYLGLTRLCLAQTDLIGAREHLERARRLVAETGYGRRRPELDDLDRQLAAR